MRSTYCKWSNAHNSESNPIKHFITGVVSSTNYQQKLLVLSNKNNTKSRNGFNEKL